jgi:hypothetical protein
MGSPSPPHLAGSPTRQRNTTLVSEPPRRRLSTTPFLVRRRSPPPTPPPSPTPDRSRPIDCRRRRSQDFPAQSKVLPFCPHKLGRDHLPPRHVSLLPKTAVFLLFSFVRTTFDVRAAALTPNFFFRHLRSTTARANFQIASFKSWPASPGIHHMSALGAPRLAVDYLVRVPWALSKGRRRFFGQSSQPSLLFLLPPPLSSLSLFFTASVLSSSRPTDTHTQPHPSPDTRPTPPYHKPPYQHGET